jgi:hypothetical protein
VTYRSHVQVRLRSLKPSFGHRFAPFSFLLAGDRSSGGRTRTCDTRIMIPLL